MSHRKVYFSGTEANRHTVSHGDIVTYIASAVGAVGLITALGAWGFDQANRLSRIETRIRDASRVEAVLRPGQTLYGCYAGEVSEINLTERGFYVADAEPVPGNPGHYMVADLDESGRADCGAKPITSRGE